MKKPAFIFISFLLIASCASGQIIYVDANAPSGGDGLTWGTAYNYLQDALTYASSHPDVNEIWVAQGIYTPDSNESDPSGNGDRTATFELIDEVALYGGFAGGESSLEQRNWQANETILSGDLDANDTPGLDPCDLPNAPNRAENSYHVVTGSGTDANTILDGFTITAGNANGSYPNETGGGMDNGSGSPTVNNCTFIGNSADYGGGMFNVYPGRPTVTNCTFRANSAYEHGGGM